MSPGRPIVNRKSSSSSPSPKGPSRLKIADGASQKFPFIEYTPKGLFIRIRLAPRSSKDFIDGVQGGSLKVRLTAPPVEGEANRALIEFLSSLLKIKKSSIEINSGLKSRDKRVRVDGVSLKGLEEAFSKILA